MHKSLVKKGDLLLEQKSLLNSHFWHAGQQLLLYHRLSTFSVVLILRDRHIKLGRWVIVSRKESMSWWSRWWLTLSFYLTCFLRRRPMGLSVAVPRTYNLCLTSNWLACLHSFILILVLKRWRLQIDGAICLHCVLVWHSVSDILVTWFFNIFDFKRWPFNNMLTLLTLQLSCSTLSSCSALRLSLTIFLKLFCGRTITATHFLWSARLFFSL